MASSRSSRIVKLALDSNLQKSRAKCKAQSVDSNSKQYIDGHNITQHNPLIVEEAEQYTSYQKCSSETVVEQLEPCAIHPGNENITVLEHNGNYTCRELELSTGKECGSKDVVQLQPWSVQHEDNSVIVLELNNILQEAELNTSGKECTSNAVTHIQPGIFQLEDENISSIIDINGDCVYDIQTQTLNDHNYSLQTIEVEEHDISLPLTDSNSFLLDSNIDFDPDNFLDGRSSLVIEPTNYQLIPNSLDNDLLNNDELHVASENEDEVFCNSDSNYEPLNKSSTDESCDDANHSREVQNKKKRAKRGRAEKENWTAISNKIKRMKGKDYEGRRTNEEGKVVFDVKKPKRNIKARCSCQKTKKNKFKCYQMTEERRQQVFDHFWGLDWGQRKIEVDHLVDRKDVQQRTVPGTQSRRQSTLQYYLKPQENTDRICVCKKMFLNSLGVGEWMIRNWALQNDKKNENNQTEKNDTNAQDSEVIDTENTAKGRKEKSDSSIRKLIKDFLDSLPKLESHYCRKDTQKLYLEPCWQSKAQLFRQYKSYCQSMGNEKLIASTFTFHEVFENCNLGLFTPKKDQCDICCAHQQGNVSEEEYNVHISRKNKAREEKTKDKEQSNDKTAVFTMDVQAVLLYPSLQASALYYRRKLKVHNFTVYNLKSHEGFCYLWDESEGGVNADEFSTILHHFITTEVDLDKVERVILYSDGCTSQNRNVTLANALLIASHQTGVEITQKFLEKGHTQMECDSIHSNIEKKLRNREIYSPAGYVEVCKTARLKPEPYKVIQLEHTFFKKYQGLNIVSSIRPGKKKGDPCVTDLRCIQYKPDVTIQVKLNPQDEFFDLPQRIKLAQAGSANVGPLYETRLPIDAVKFQHLQELKLVIPKEIHSFYDNLPHQ